jgi:hypothetical protein
LLRKSKEHVLREDDGALIGMENWWQIFSKLSVTGIDVIILCDQ